LVNLSRWQDQSIAFAFCLPLLLLAEVFSQGKLHTPFSYRSTHGSSLITTHVHKSIYKKSSPAPLKLQGSVQAMRRRNGKQFGALRQAVDLLARTEESGRRNPNNPHIEVMLQYYRKYPCRNKFKYDHTDSKWIDVDCIISTVTMSYNFTNKVYTLDRNDSEQLSKFVTKRTI
jgi:hypothetical protein